MHLLARARARTQSKQDKTYKMTHKQNFFSNCKTKQIPKRVQKGSNKTAKPHRLCCIQII